MKAAALATTLLVSLALAFPEAAQACAVCAGGGGEETRSAFLLTTIFLSVLPPAILGGGLLWLWRRSRALQRRAEAGAEPVGTSDASAPVAAR